MNLIMFIGLYLLTGMVLFIATITVTVVYAANRLTKGDEHPANVLEENGEMFIEATKDKRVAGLAIIEIVKFVAMWPVKIPEGINALQEALKK